MKTEEAINILNRQRNDFLEKYVDYGGVNEAYDLAIKALTKKIRERPERLLPCKCGCKRREHWYGCTEQNAMILKCYRCEFQASGANEIEVHKAWNKAVSDERPDEK